MKRKLIILAQAIGLLVVMFVFENCLISHESDPPCEIPDTTFINDSNQVALDLADCSVWDTKFLIGEAYRDLQWLDLSNNPLDEISTLAALQDLEYLDLHFCHGLKDMACLLSLRKLKYLNIGSTYIDSLNALALLSQLEILDAGGNYKLHTIDPLVRCTSLVVLDLHYSSMLKDISACSGLTNLKELNLGLCPRLTNIIVLGRCESIEILDLSSCHSITAAPHFNSGSQIINLSLKRCYNLSNISGIKTLSNLKVLNLEASKKITDISAVKDLTSIINLNICGLENINDYTPLLSCLDAGDYLRTDEDQLPDSIENILSSNQVYIDAW